MTMHHAFYYHPWRFPRAPTERRIAIARGEPVHVISMLSKARPEELADQIAAETINSAASCGVKPALILVRKRAVIAPEGSTENPLGRLARESGELQTYQLGKAMKLGNGEYKIISLTDEENRAYGTRAKVLKEKLLEFWESEKK